jgi:hypothetical protein
VPADSMGKTASHRSQFHSLIACRRVGVVEPNSSLLGRMNRMLSFPAVQAMHQGSCSPTARPRAWRVDPRGSGLNAH